MGQAFRFTGRKAVGVFWGSSFGDGLRGSGNSGGFYESKLDF